MENFRALYTHTHTHTDSEQRFSQIEYNLKLKHIAHFVSQRWVFFFFLLSLSLALLSSSSPSIWMNERLNSKKEVRSAITVCFMGCKLYMQL